MTTTPQAALLREAAQNALITLDGIADTNPRDTADFETPAEWIAWAKSRARWAADALRAPIAQEIYAERILRKMLHESDQSQATHQCGTCGHIGIEDPVKGCPKCGFDDMRAINSRDTQEPVQAGELPPLPEPDSFLFQHDETGNTMFVDAQQVEWGFEKNNPRLHKIGGAFTGGQMQAYARAAISARKPLTPLIARQLGEWHEDDGPVMWWAWNGHGWAGEPSWCGQPTDSDWPGYHTHWTPHPQQPAANGIGLEVKP